MFLFHHIFLSVCMFSSNIFCVVILIEIFGGSCFSPFPKKNILLKNLNMFRSWCCPLFCRNIFKYSISRFCSPLRASPLQRKIVSNPFRLGFQFKVCFCICFYFVFFCILYFFVCIRYFLLYFAGEDRQGLINLIRANNV